MYLFCYALLCVHSSFAKKEKAGCFATFVLQMYCYCKCSVVALHGAVGWSAVMIVVFSDHTHFFLLYLSLESRDQTSYKHLFEFPNIVFHIVICL